MKKHYLLLFLLGFLSISLVKAEDGSEIRSLDYTFSSVNEYPEVIFQTSSTSVTCSGTEIIMQDGDRIDAIVESEGDFIMVLNMHNVRDHILSTPYNIYDNGNLIETYSKGMAGTDNGGCQKSIDFRAGNHTITIEALEGAVSFSINFLKDTEVIATLSEPGSLGTEILYANVEKLQDVHKLKVIGEMNEEDWNKIIMMKISLVELDLSQAITSSIPDNAFESLFSGYNFDKWSPVRKVILPEGLISIGNKAFYNSYIENINFPTTLQKIDDEAFKYSTIKEALMSDNTQNLGRSVFMNCLGLETISLSKDLTIIPDGLFRGCNLLKNFEVPQNLTEIGSFAFFGCRSINFDIPSSVSKLGLQAFFGTNNDLDNIKETLIWPESCTSEFSEWVFNDTKYKNVIFPVGFNFCKLEVVSGDIIQTIRLSSPTIVKGNGIIGNKDKNKNNIIIEVPDFLVNSYKLDDYWYDFKGIIGFDASEISKWIIKDDLILSSHDRFTNTPSIIIELDGSLKVNGTDEMPLNELCVYGDPDNTKYGRIFSNADGVTVASDLWTRMRLGTSNKWYFLSFPYDIKVSDIQNINESPQWAIRYYDGSNRAENGPSGSWKNFEEDAIIPAGTGFIMNISQGAWFTFPSQENDTKQYGTSVNIFNKSLEEYPAAEAANQGWNLVGNPYFCYYNIHKLNFTAPITVRQNNNYVAYSIIDDDYALRPFEAFFVQCPTSNYVIEFPLEGRQMTSTITSQQGAPTNQHQDLLRKIINLSAFGNGNSDITRIVFNEEASLAYEFECDACKFIGDDEEIPQIYSIDSDGIRYAINERPELEGIVHLGFLSKHNGTYTIKADLCQFINAYLFDSYTGITTDLVNRVY